MAELALAIVPLCLAAIEATGAVGTRLKLMRRHDREVRLLRKKFQIQSSIFLDECQDLLQEFCGRETAHEMMRNSNHHNWQTPRRHWLQERMKTRMGRRYGEVCEIVNSIQGHVKSLGKRLGFDDIDSAHPAGRATMFSRQAFDLVLHKSDYDATLSDLREDNQELRRLRERISACGTTTSSAKSPNPMPESWTTATQNCKSFYHALSSFWSCLEIQHEGHDVRVMLEAEDECSLHVVLSYHSQDISVTQCGHQDFIVYSSVIQLYSANTDTCLMTPPKHLGQRPRKVRKLRRQEDFSEAIPSPPPEGNPNDNIQSSSLALNLSSTPNTCDQLCSLGGGSKGKLPEGPSHFINAPNNYRHTLTPVWVEGRKGSVGSLGDIVRQSIDLTSLSLPQRMRLAARLVCGVLKFHSTPWMKPYWSLGDLRYFDDRGDDDDENTVDSLSRSLRTLHLTAELSEQKHTSASSAANLCATPNSAAAAEDDDYLRFGVRNPTMHSLGVALLQIGRWAPLALDDLVGARRLGGRTGYSLLGPGFEAMTRKCLDCDFGAGQDLARPQLRQAIWADVVCPLEDMIGVLEGDGS